MKRLFALLVAVLLLFSLVACGAPAENTPAADSPATNEPVADAPEGGDVPADSGEPFEMALIMAQFSDTHLTNVRRNVERRLGTYDDINVTAMDSMNTVEGATNNWNLAITQGYDLVATNDKGQLPGIPIKLFGDAGIPLIIWNSSQPTDEELSMYPGMSFFVSSAAEESGYIQGEEAVKYWNEHPESDRNGNGIMDYVMLQGTQGFFDTTVRTRYSIESVVNAGIEVNCVADEVARFIRVEAQDKMAAIIAANSDNIEYVFANNDDMALGAIEAMKAAGFFADESSFIPVFGVDATETGMAAVLEGTILATSLNNPVAMGEAIAAIARLVKDGKEVNTENLRSVGGWIEELGLEVDAFGRVWTHYTKVMTQEDIDAIDLSGEYLNAKYPPAA